MFVDTAWSLFPPLLAITLAIATRKVYLALGLGIVSGAILLEKAFLAGIVRSITLVWDTLNEPGNALIIAFIFAVGSLISSIQGVGGIKGLVNWLERSGYLSTPRSVRLLAWWSGVLLFIESNMTILVAGTLARPLFDRWKISREKLAYLIDSTSGPICLLIPFNAWGVYVISLLQTVGEKEPVSLFVHAILFNFYSFLAILLALLVALFDFNLGPMKPAEERTQAGGLLFEGSTPMADETFFQPPEKSVTASKWLLVAPVLAMLCMMPISLYFTGRLAAPNATDLLDVLKHGRGGIAVLASALTALLLLAVVQLLRNKKDGVTMGQLLQFATRGARGMLGLATIILLALTLGLVTKLLGTGNFVADLASDNLSPGLFLPLVFLMAAFVSFSTGTSWGTFAIMIPVALPAAAVFGVAKAPFLAAALSGGVFGDHASPISNTTIIASMAAMTDHTDHVRTQLPYCLLAGLVATVGYVLVGAFAL